MQVSRNTSVQQACMFLVWGRYIRLVTQKDIKEQESHWWSLLGAFVADLSPVQDPAPQQLKTLKSDHHHIPLTCQAPSSLIQDPKSLLSRELLLLLSSMSWNPSSLAHAHHWASNIWEAATEWTFPEARYKRDEQAEKQVSPHMLALLRQGTSLYSRVAINCFPPVPKDTARSRPSAPSTAAQSQLSRLHNQGKYCSTAGIKR